MSAAAATAVDLPRFRRRRELLIGAAVTAIIGALVVVAGPGPGDAGVHLYRTWLVRHGIHVWDNFSYAGWYPLTSYSLLYYLRPRSSESSARLRLGGRIDVLFSSIAMREWGRAALWPSRVFGVLAAAPMFTGLYAYSLGFTAMLATLKLLQLAASQARGSRRDPHRGASARSRSPSSAFSSSPTRSPTGAASSGETSSSGSASAPPRRSRTALVPFPQKNRHLPVPLDRLPRSDGSSARRGSPAPGRRWTAFFSLSGASQACSSTSSRRRSGTT